MYLLKKQSCSKYYFIWSVGSHYNQKQLINDLKNTKLIISKGPSFDWDLPTSKKLPLVNNYINQNFYITQKIQDWEILKTNEINQITARKDVKDFLIKLKNLNLINEKI